MPESNARLMHAVSISMPSSPLNSHTLNTKRVLFADRDEIATGGNGNPGSTPSEQPKQTWFHSQPMPSVSGQNPPRHPRVQALKDKRFDSFKTWSGKLERQLTNLRGKPHPTSPEDNNTTHSMEINLPVERFFDALEGPELDILRVCTIHTML